jgi:hypothetical protein
MTTRFPFSFSPIALGAVLVFVIACHQDEYHVADAGDGAGCESGGT